MADFPYCGDYFMETGIEIKQESNLESDVKQEPVSASVPIPRRAVELTDLRDFNFELDIGSQDSRGFHANFFNKMNFEDSNSKCDPFKMDDDDIFQVDKADLIQGPTLAELNANDDTLLDDLNFDDLLLPEENSFYLNLGGAIAQSGKRHAPATPRPSPATPSLLNGLGSASSSPFDPYALRGASAGAFSPASQHSSASSSAAPALLELMRRERPPAASPAASPASPAFGRSAPSDMVLGQSVPLPFHFGAASPAPGAASAPSRARPGAPGLSSSAPTHLSLEQIWQRREPRKHLLSTSSVAEVGSVSSLSGGVRSPEGQDFSQDEDDNDSDEDSDRYEDLSSDGDSDIEYDGKTKSSKKEKFFWQYNVQAKGPKGQRLVLKTKLEDPHVLNEVTDPVFSPSCSVRGIKHSGKARKGDGNDLTPNPRKLFLIGKELDKLGRIINDMTPVSELPFNVRPKTRKEKNKLASRACRLKKKAQHEANKLKLYGLEHEHKRLLNGIEQVKHVIISRLNQTSGQGNWNSHLDHIVKSATKVTIAGQSSEYVNKVLDRVKSGVPDGDFENL